MCVCVYGGGGSKIAPKNTEIFHILNKYLIVDVKILRGPEEFISKAVPNLIEYESNQ